MAQREGKHRMGWLPDFPDLRDYTEKTGAVKEVLEPTGVMKAKSLPPSVDLRKWCSPVEDQGNLDRARPMPGRGSLNTMREKPMGGTLKPPGSFFIKSPEI